MVKYNIHQRSPLIISSVINKLAKGMVSANGNENYRAPSDEHDQKHQDF